ncbi:MAG TPA: ABC transporter permease [Gemmatimonadaceae bacterium]|nr:ABC transporter permease [Gemmatimonadaceae bacterium]
MTWFRWVKSRPNPTEEVSEELAFHIEMRSRDLERRGAPPDEARQIALRKFGDYQSSFSACVEIDERRMRRMARSEYLTELRQDLTYALRTLRRTPAFTAVAVGSLALGIGATSAIFSVVRGVLLESLPYRAAERLYEVQTLYPDGTGYSLSAPDFMSVREANRAFERVEAYSGGTFTLLGVGEPREVQGASVSDGLFEMLGLRIALGRGFNREEFQPGRGMVTILNHAYWQSEFGGDRSVLGRTLSVGGDPYTIIGVLGPGAQLPEGATRRRFDGPQMYAPLEYDSTFSAATSVGRRGEFLRVLGRARTGVTPEQIDSDLSRVGTVLQSQFPQTNGNQTFNAKSLQKLIVGEVRQPLLILFGAVAFVLLIACANIANLLLARISVRQDELAVRGALGAGRGRLVRQLMTEAVVLGLAGGIVGLIIAYWGTKALIAAQPADLPRLNNIGVNFTVVLFTLGLAVLTGFAFGVLPAMQATGSRMMSALREGGRGGGASGSSHRLRAGLVVAEMALAVGLLTGAGLLIRSFIELTRVNPGFQPERAIGFRVVMQGDDYREGQQIRDRLSALLDRLRALPGVTATAATTVLPLSGRSSLVDFAVPGEPPPPNVNAEIGMASVTPDYFRAIGTPLLRGRGISDQDRNDGPPVALINEAGARQWFPGEDPVGQTVLAAGGTERQIVGLISDVLERDMGREAMPMLFVPHAQRTNRTVRIVVRTAGDPLALAPSIRAQVRALDPNLPVAEMQPLHDLISASMARPRFYTSLLTLFAAVALILAATGIFGVLSYAVAQRSREIGIRMALGAPAGRVVRMVVGQAMLMAVIGLVAGIGLALMVGRVLRSQLYGVSAVDPVTLGMVVIVLGASAIVASLTPARRAAAVDPVSALREG